jgi:L-seryl-tRNA(Ser) seleniumtransferase
MVAASGTVDVELDLATGQRTRRGRGAVAAILTAVPDAEAALVVNNGAAALVLATTALAAGREVVVSRGEMVEIGDGFRLPELIASAGARLREVGTTNRTTLGDYASALGSDTGCILTVHPSNFRIEGFTSSVGVRELATLGPPVVHDIGSGLLAPHPLMPDEPDAATSLRAGASIVTCSGDKLLGGPQAGLVLGQADAVERLRRHPLARAVRADKTTLAALEATLRGPRTPVWQALEADPDTLRARCEDLVANLPESLDARTVPADGVVGGGGAPGLHLHGWAVALPESYAAALRTLGQPVLARVERGRCLVDPRCVPQDADGLLAQAIREASERLAVTQDSGGGSRQS